MDEKTIRKMRLEYEKECIKTTILARKALITILNREAKGKTLH